ncbi:MAG TPA: DNA polymerase III subunit delta' [Candidatus Pullilachnospira intestinigallinarum]|nr:DNA polymerase III subunit delta' [Candidatus Pullilachnospira intestinigallinarum]
MPGFEEIVGHKEVIRHLQNAIRLGKVSHAYIFSGETGCGKKLLATAFAMTLQCEQRGVDPCLTCSSCKKAMSKNHPDIIHITHEKPNSIGIEDIRSQLIDDVAIKPYCSSYKIYIISEAEKLTLQAQNALLKTIEEPPAYAVILLLTNNMDALLPTITSRCVKLALRPVKESMVKEYLMEKLHIPDYQAKMDASLAQGNIGKAKQLAQSEDFAQITENALRLLRRSNDMELYELVDAVKTLSADKQNIYDYLDLFTMWFRDVLLFKATREVDGLVFKDQFNDIKERAGKSSYEGLETIIDAIEKARTRLHANVNFDLVMELLFLTIKEN